MAETEAVQFLEDHGVPVARLQGGSLRFLYDHQSAVSIEERIEEQIREVRVRDEFIARFGFAILTRHAVEALLRYQPMLEVGAGSGYWAYELLRAGADVVATDPGSGKYHMRNQAQHWSQPWTKIHRLTGTRAVRKYPHRTLLMVWPDFQVTWPAATLNLYEGRTVIYVGEGQGGRTADDNFHAMLRDQFDLNATVPLPQFFGLHDHMEIWRR